MIRRSRCLKWLPLFCLAFLGFAWLLIFPSHLEIKIQQHFPLRSSLANSSSLGTDSTASHNRSESALIAFWHAASKALLDAKPPCALPVNSSQASVTKFTSIKKGKGKLPDVLRIPQHDVDDLRGAHSRFVAQIPGLVPLLPLIKASQGIVTTASGEFLPTLLVSLRMLRRTGCKLPVQVLVHNREVYEKEICEEVLPAMNVTCFLLSDILDAVTQHIDISVPRFQLRIFAALFSSFDNILLLDVDNIVVEKPEQWMNANPFISTGFVSWPDYWASTASPIYYDISSQAIPPLSDRASSESGQILFSKTKHASTLLLALYYNLYGPSHYYELLSQGSIGQGDKETYLAAAMSLNASVYTVSTPVEELGFTNDNKEFQGCGASHFNAEDDYSLHVLRNQSVQTPRRAFVHAQTYKMNAAQVVEHFHNEIHGRMWGPKEKMMERFGRDLEKQVWAETLATGCQYPGYFRDWQANSLVCRNIGRVYNFITTL